MDPRNINLDGIPPRIADTLRKRWISSDVDAPRHGPPGTFVPGMYRAMGGYMSAVAYFRISPIEHFQFMFSQSEDCLLNLDMEKLVAAALEFYEKSPGEAFDVHGNWKLPYKPYM